MFDGDVDDEDGSVEMKQGVGAYMHTYDATAIELKNFGLEDISIDDPYALRRQRIVEGEDKFFLRQLIYAYKYLRTNEKIPLQESDFYKIYKNITQVPFYTKKSPIGILIAYYLYDAQAFMKQDRFKRIMGLQAGQGASADAIAPLKYASKVTAGDLVRYVRLLHELFKK